MKQTEAFKSFKQIQSVLQNLISQILFEHFLFFFVNNGFNFIWDTQVKQFGVDSTSLPDSVFIILQYSEILPAPKGGSFAFKFQV